jgi:hypothetical protein
MKAHKSEMIAAWARDHKIDGFEQYDPQWQAKNRMRALKWRDKQNAKKDNHFSD